MSKSFSVFKNSSDSILDQDSQIYKVFIKTTKKYKPVTLKIKPVGSTLPSQFRIVRNIIGDPLTDLPILPFQGCPYLVKMTVVPIHGIRFARDGSTFECGAASVCRKGALVTFTQLMWASNRCRLN